MPPGTNVAGALEEALQASITAIKMYPLRYRITRPVISSRDSPGLNGRKASPEIESGMRSFTQPARRKDMIA
jgi:hypothetical protein